MWFWRREPAGRSGGLGLSGPWVSLGRRTVFLRHGSDPGFGA